MIIDKLLLNNNPNAIFVFGDNLERWGHGGAAVLRDHPQSCGFITKKRPSNDDSSFYMEREYENVFRGELAALIDTIIDNPGKTFFISQLGAGLANKFGIWEKVIKPGLEVLRAHSNVIFCWET